MNGSREPLGLPVPWQPSSEGHLAGRLTTTRMRDPRRERHGPAPMGTHSATTGTRADGFRRIEVISQRAGADTSSCFDHDLDSGATTTIAAHGDGPSQR